MKSRTLSSNLRVFKKDLTRFAPTWVEYTAVLFIVYYFLLSGDGNINRDGDGQDFLSYFALGNALYGFICAVNLFGYLTDPRECNTVHAFPIRREEYFLIHTVAGFIMALIPNALFILMNIPISTGSLVPHFVGMMLEFVFFFGLATFCMFLTGRKFAAATLYALFNWLSMQIYWAVEVIFLPSLPGIELNFGSFINLTPLLKMMQEENQLMTIAVYAAVGLGLMAASLLLYRRRKLEYAGDFIAVKWLTPVFLVALSIAAGCGLSACGTLFDSDVSYFLLGAGLVIGYFSGQMLLKRTIRVFSLRSVGGAAALVGAVFASIFLTAVDPFGRVEYVPEVDDVVSVQIRHYEGNTLCYETADPAVIADITDLHGDILHSSDFDTGEPYNGGEYFHLTYKLKTGQTVIRYYRPTGDEENRVCFYLSQPEIQLDVSTEEELLAQYDRVMMHYYDRDTDEYLEETVSGAQAQELLKTIYRECREGKMYPYDYAATNELSISIRQTQRDYYFYLNIPETATDSWQMIMELLSE